MATLVETPLVNEPIHSKQPLCAIADCDRLALGISDLCARHDLQERRRHLTGEPLAERRPPPPPTPIARAVRPAATAPPVTPTPLPRREPAVRPDTPAGLTPDDGWEVWTQGRGIATISIQRNGMLLVNLAAEQLLGQPAYVQLLYQASPCRIGVRSCPKEASGAITVRRQKQGGFHLSTKAFFEHHQIDYSATRRYRAERAGAGTIAIDPNAAPLHDGRGRP